MSVAALWLYVHNVYVLKDISMFYVHIVKYTFIYIQQQW